MKGEESFVKEKKYRVPKALPPEHLAGAFAAGLPDLATEEEKKERCAWINRQVWPERVRLQQRLEEEKLAAGIEKWQAFNEALEEADNWSGRKRRELEAADKLRRLRVASAAGETKRLAERTERTRGENA